ncbi:MAG: beta-ketoacyl-ACP synthase II [Anaerolineae bacterium]
MQRIVVTGLGAVTPIGNDVPTFWKNLIAGQSGADTIRAFDPTDFPVKIGCEVKDFKATDWMERKLVKRTAQMTQFALAAARQALADANFEITEENRDEVGVIVNTGGGGIPFVENATYTLLDKGPRAVGPFVVPSIMPNAVSCLISIETGATGPILTSTLACASGNYAMVEGLHMLQRGEAKVIIAGGSERSATRVTFAAFDRMGALSRRNHDPQKASRPFDADRDGFVYGEGAGVFILETEEHAQARGAKIYAEVAGGSLTGDAYHVTAPEPTGRGAIRAIKLALKESGLKAEDVSVIYAHGTSTPLNDATETKAIKAALGEHAYQVPITATKSMVGHGMGAAGAIAAVGAVMTIREGIVPPTINYETPDPDCDLDYVPNEARKHRADVVLINAFGFGGQNVVLVLKRYEG